MVRIFKEVSGVSHNDAVGFDPNGVKVGRVREETEYGGLRITADALVDTAKARSGIEFAFADAVEPGLLDMDLSVLNDLPAPHLRASAREMVIAWKFLAMVMLDHTDICGARGLSLADT